MLVRDDQPAGCARSGSGFGDAAGEVLGGSPDRLAKGSMTMEMRASAGAGAVAATALTAATTGRQGFRRGARAAHDYDERGSRRSAARAPSAVSS